MRHVRWPCPALADKIDRPCHARGVLRTAQQPCQHHSASYAPASPHTFHVCAIGCCPVLRLCSPHFWHWLQSPRRRHARNRWLKAAILYQRIQHRARKRQVKARAINVCEILTSFAICGAAVRCGRRKLVYAAAAHAARHHRPPDHPIATPARCASMGASQASPVCAPQAAS